MLSNSIITEDIIHNDLFQKVKHECNQVGENTFKIGALKDGKYRTFWLSKDEEPKTLIEYIVQQLSIQDFSNDFPENYAGAEWWVQLRGSKENIVFHYDKDEALCTRENKFIFPLFSTVTYLTNIGGPTAIFKDQENSQGYLCFPKVNKHILFDGKAFHGVIGSLAKTVPSEQEKRLTLLINYWHQKPEEPNCIYCPYEHFKLAPLTEEDKQLQSSVKVNPSKLIRMNYNNGTQKLTIYRMKTPIELLFAKNLKEERTYLFHFLRKKEQFNIFSPM